MQYVYIEIASHSQRRLPNLEDLPADTDVYLDA